MKRAILLLVPVLLLLGWKVGARVLHPYPPRLVSAAELAGGAETRDPCFQKSRCVVAYVAPWCGVCEADMPYLLKIRDHWKGNSSNGIRIIVGADRPEKTKSLALKIGDGAYVDGAGVFALKMGVEHYPTVWVLGENEQVLAVDQSAYAWVAHETGGLVPPAH